ncbi:hypothetical protein [Flavobacterium sp. W21_SRS_FM6]|uniref:hypothetical protein n=1 Tax=Flavobacterium sp. W21_SRS_FM6 TaxID=3240268 RepID=UPI003F91191C
MKLSRILFLLALSGFSGLSATYSYADTPEFRFSGFSRVVLGTLDDKNASYEGYDNNISAGEGSLLGLQLDVDLSETFSLTSQLLAHSSENRNSGVEWLYLSYHPIPELNVKLGRQRAPFHLYSDTLDVGYAYPWINPPQQVYSGYLFDQFDGIDLTYEISAEDFNAEFEAYWGEFKDELSVSSVQKIDTEVTNMLGLVLTVKSQNFTFRASTVNTDFSVEIPEMKALADILYQLNYTLSADSLKTQGKVQINQLGMTYDNIDYFVKSEITQVTSPVIFVPDIISYYVSAGKTVDSFTYHFTYGRNNADFAEPVVEIRAGLDPQIDALSAGYKTIFDTFPNDVLTSYALGVRWDVKVGMALKAEVTHLRGVKGERSYFNIQDLEKFDYKANLIQVAWEWVF